VRDFAEHVPVATPKTQLLDGELLEHVTTAMHCIQSHVDCYTTHTETNEPPKHSHSYERDNSTVEGGDLHTVRPEPTSGRELITRRQKTNGS
jgi:hypothetical protein